MTNAIPTGKGMLSTEAARKSFFATLVDLYKSDLAFRGMVDFAVIGALTMMFLNPPHKVQWPWSGGGTTSATGGGLAGGPSSTTVGPGPGGKIAAGPVIPIPFGDMLLNPRLGTDFLFDFDRSAFSSSKVEDRPRLEAARLAIARGDHEEATDKLREANGDDPNVALLRGAAFAMQGTQDGNRTAEAMWRQAINGGNTQAKALLGRLLASGAPGVTANVAEAQRLIEAGVDDGDRQAMRIAGIGHLSGDLGILDPPKAAELLKRAADAGDAMAMALYARVLADGIGVGAADGKQAQQYLEKASEAGLTIAQFTLGPFLTGQFGRGLVPTPQEGLDWLKKAYERGHSLEALSSLAYLHAEIAKAPPWRDVPRAMDYLRRCSGFADAICHYNIAYAWNAGFFGRVDPVSSRAHYEVARTLGYAPAADELKTLDARLTQSQLADAAALEQKIRAELKPIPPKIHLQYAELAGSPPPEAVAPGIPLIDVPAHDDTGQATNSTASSPAMDALRKRAYGHMEGNDYESAIADFTDIIRQGNATWEDYNQRGLAHHSKRQLDLALEDYSRAIARNAHAAAAYYNRALVHNEKQDLDSALADLNTAIKEDGAQASHYLGRGNLHFRKDALQAAGKDFDTYIDLVSKGKTATADDKALGYLMRGKVRLQQAMQEGDTCKRMTPPDPSCNEATKFQPALQDFEQALVVQPDYSDAHFHIGWVADALGNSRKAIDSYTYALKSDPNNSSAYNNRGVIYGNMGQRDLALADYNDAIRTDPENKFAWANRAALFAGARNRKQAIADYRQALRLDPNYEYALTGLRKLGARP